MTLSLKEKLKIMFNWHQLCNLFFSTASEPNLLKIRLKQSVIERKARAGPMGSKRHERILQAAQRRLQKHHNQQISSAST